MTQSCFPLLFPTFLAGRFPMFPPFPGTGPEPLCVLLLQSQQREHNITKKKPPLSKNSAGTASDAPKQTNKQKKGRAKSLGAWCPQFCVWQNQYSANCSRKSQVTAKNPIKKPCWKNSIAEFLLIKRRDIFFFLFILARTQNLVRIQGRKCFGDVLMNKHTEQQYQ